MSQKEWASGVPGSPLRNAAFEDRVESLVAARPLSWICTQAGIGKRIAIAAWLRHTSADQKIVWLTLAPEAIQHREALGLIFDATGLVNHEHPIVDEIPDCESLTRRRSRARDAIQARGQRTMLVIDLGIQRLAPSELNAIAIFTSECPTLRILFIQDDDLYQLSRSSEHPSQLNAEDLRIAIDPLRREFAGLAHPIPDAMAVRIVEEYHGLFSLAIALVAEMDCNPQQDINTSFATALAHVLSEVAHQLMPEGAPIILALLALIPEMHESHLATAVVGPRVDIELRSLKALGLLKSVTTPEGEYIYSLSGSVREIVRSITLPYYLRNRRALHQLACDYYVAIGDVSSAVEQLHRLGEPDEAISLFAAQWSSYRRLNGDAKSRELCSSFAVNNMYSHPEASAAIWLICSNTPSAEIAVAYETRILGVINPELSTLTARARLTIDTARMLIFLDRGRPELAAQIASETTADRESVLRQNPSDTGELNLEYLLAIARTALSNGSFRAAATHFHEALALSKLICDPVSTYRALSGLALTLTVNGELTAARELIHRARALEQELNLPVSQTSAEIIWCECLARTFTGEERTIDAEIPLFNDHPRLDDVWAGMSDFAQAQTMFRTGQNLAAAGVLMNRVSSLAVPHNTPLLRQMTVCLLSWILTASNQPGAALEALAGESSNEGHFPCIDLMHAHAHIARGDPRAAINATNACLGLGQKHAIPSLAYVYIARALAFEATGSPTSAEDAFITAASIAGNSGIQVNLEMLTGQQLAGVRARSREEIPETVALALNIKCSNSQHSNRRSQSLAKLTNQERRVLSELLSPLTLAEIAANLFISTTTIKTHSRNLYRKLGVRSRREAADLARTWGMAASSVSPIDQ